MHKHNEKKKKKSQSACEPLNPDNNASPFLSVNPLKKKTLE